MKKPMKMVLGLGLIIVVAISIVWVGRGFENGQPVSRASQNIPTKWCQEFTDDPAFQPDRAGWCYRLTGTVATVDAPRNVHFRESDTYIALEVDHGVSDLFTVYMRSECNRWEEGDPFDEIVGLGSSGPVLRCE